MGCVTYMIARPYLLLFYGFSSKIKYPIIIVCSKEADNKG